MIQEPTINITVLAAGNAKRRQFLTTLSLKSILMLVQPIIQKKTTGAGLRENSLAARKIATLWDQRGEIESIKPIVIAINDTCRYKARNQTHDTGAGFLECPLSAFVDVCDGIQRISALKNVLLKPADFTANEWPVHLIETHGEDDLAALTDHIRKPIISKQRSAPVKKRGADRWLTAILTESSFLRRAVAIRKSSLAPRSGHLWTGSAMIKALSPFIASDEFTGTAEEVKKIAAIWDCLPRAIPALGDYAEGRIKASQLREESILAQAPTLTAIAVVLVRILASPEESRDVCLQKLSVFNWSISSQSPNMISRVALRGDRIHQLLALYGLQLPTKQAK